MRHRSLSESGFETYRQNSARSSFSRKWRPSFPGVISPLREFVGIDLGREPVEAESADAHCELWVHMPVVQRPDRHGNMRRMVLLLARQARSIAGEILHQLMALVLP